MKRLLLTSHRWLGAILSPLFAVWFASGMVMVFAGFPRLDEERRLARLPALVLPADLPLPGVALAGQAASGRIRLGTLGGEPVYRFVDGDQRAGLVAARPERRRSGPLSPEQAAELAAAFLARRGADGEAAAAVGPALSPGPERETGAGRTPAAPLAPGVQIDRRDQWNTTSPREAQFPLQRLDAGDAARTQIYVSLVTGEVVQATTRRDRLLAWLGAIPHWIYPIALRRHAGAWRQVVLWLSGVGTVVALSGLVLGVWHLRLRRRRRRPREASPLPLSPYRERWLRWHHHLGLLFGLLAFTWVGSGMLSLTPWRWSDPSGPPVDEAAVLAGGPLDPSRFRLPPAEALARCRERIRPREIELVQLAGRPFYLCRESSSASRLVAAGAPSPTPTRAAPRFTPAEVLAAAAPLWRGHLPGDVALLEDGDAYFYRKAYRGGPLPPLLRVRLGDPQATWYYFDLSTGRLAQRLDRLGRLERWLYNGLHSLDFPALYRRPHLWRPTIVLLNGAGLALAVTSLAVTASWLARLRRRRLAATRSTGRPPAEQDRPCATGA